MSFNKKLHYHWSLDKYSDLYKLNHIVIPLVYVSVRLGLKPQKRIQSRFD